MPMRRIPNQVNGKPIVTLLKHPKGFAETEIAHDIERKVVRQLGHILGFIPCL